MASQRIIIDTNASSLAAGLLATINQAAEARARLARFSDYAVRASDGGVDLAAFAAAFGIPPAQAQEAYNLVTGAAASLSEPGDFDNLLDRAATQ